MTGGQRRGGAQASSSFLTPLVTVAALAWRQVTQRTPHDMAWVRPEGGTAAVLGVSRTNLTLGREPVVLQTQTLRHYGLSDAFDRSVAFLLQVGGA